MLMTNMTSLNVSRSLCLGLLIFIYAIVARAQADIVIGQSLAQQGADVDGRSFRIAAGTTAAVNAINAAGGIRGRQIKLVTLNNDDDFAKQERNMASLVRDNRVAAILNCVGDKMCRVSAEAAVQLKVPLVGMFTGTSTIQRALHPYAFRIRTGYQREAEALAKQLHSIGNQRVVLITDTASESEAVTELRKAIAGTGLAMTQVRIDAREPNSIAQLFLQLGKGGFDSAVLELSAAGVAALLINNGDQRAEWPTFIATLSGSTRSMVMGGFPSRTIAFTAVTPDPEKVNTRLVRELHKGEVGSYAASHDGLEAYINTKVLAEALRRTKGAIDGAKLAASIAAVDSLDLGGYRVHFGNGRENASDYIEVNVRSRLSR